jgi:hypothetical protein
MLIRDANRQLMVLLGRSGGVVDTGLLRCAAGVLEGCAIVWTAAGSADGERHVHLLRRLEERLAACERDVLSAETERRVTAPAAASAARAAAQALRLLEAEHADAGALAALEDAAVRGACVAVQAAINLQEFGAIKPPSRVPSARLVEALGAVAVEVVAAAAERGGAGSSRPGKWLAQALALAVPAREIVLAADQRTDPVVCARARLAVRRQWLALGSILLLAIDGLDELIVPRLWACRCAIAEAASRQAGAALLGAQLVGRLETFDHETAWAYQRRAINASVAILSDSLEAGGDDGLEQARMLLLGRLGRTIAAISAIDGSARAPAVSGVRERAVSRILSVPIYRDQRLIWSVRVGARDGAAAALALFERWDPATLDEAVELVCPDRRPTSEAFDAIADTWARYRHIRQLPWD